MIITTSYLLILALVIFLTLFCIFIDSTRVKERLGPNFFHRIRNVGATLITLLIIWLCILNFTATLTLLVFGSGLIVLIDWLFFHRKRKAKQFARPMIIETAYAYFWVFLLVWVIRSFIVQPYRVPTGSLQPTVHPGDFLAVNQFAYGLRFPVINNKLVEINEPKRGDLVLFYAPPNPSIVYVKRLVGLPGDTVEYHDKVLSINGKIMPQKTVGTAIDDEPASENNPEEHLPVTVKEENLDGVTHKIYVMPDNRGFLGADFKITVPTGEYFMMGDNRDNSDDSRVWGFVPDRNLIGQAFAVWMNWDAINNKIDWHRIGTLIH